MTVSSVADPGSGAFLTPGSEMGNKSGSGSGITNLYHISESLEKFVGFKYLNTLIWKKFGSVMDIFGGINIPDP
jgi:hypothetical protein